MDKLYKRHRLTVLRGLIGPTKRDKIRNTETVERINAKTMYFKKLKKIKRVGKHLERMIKARLKQQALKHKIHGRRNRGRQRIRWEEQIHL